MHRALDKLSKLWMYLEVHKSLMCEIVVAELLQLHHGVKLAN